MRRLPKFPTPRVHAARHGFASSTSTRRSYRRELEWVLDVGSALVEAHSIGIFYGYSRVVTSMKTSKPRWNHPPTAYCAGTEILNTSSFTARLEPEISNSIHFSFFRYHSCQYVCFQVSVVASPPPRDISEGEAVGHFGGRGERSRARSDDSSGYSAY